MSGIEGMLIEDLFNESSTVGEALIEIGQLGKWVQAIGIVVVLWMVFQLVNLIINIYRGRALRKMKRKIDRIDEKLDNLMGKKVKKKRK